MGAFEDDFEVGASVPSSVSPAPSNQERSRCQGCGHPIPPSRGRGRPRKWCGDRCRKRTVYSSSCADCGVRVGTDDTLPVEGTEYRCRPCAAAHAAIWTADACVLAVQEWADAHGGIPPTANQYIATPGAHLPYPTTVYQQFGSFGALLEAAGFEPRRGGPLGGGYRRLTPNERASIPRRVAAGESQAEIARDLGVSHSSVNRWASR